MSELTEPNRILVIKLADLGDLLTATPALRALRERFPKAEITALVTPHTAGLLDHSDAVDQVLVFPKALYDSPRALVNPAVGGPGLWRGLRLIGQLRQLRPDVSVLLHHLYTPWGRAKYRALLAASGAPIRVGLASPPVDFLTHAAPDAGFGGRHEVDYCLDVVQELGATVATPRMELNLTDAERSAGRHVLTSRGTELDRAVVLHPGSGAFSLARRWPADRFATVGDALTAEGWQPLIVAGPGEESLARQVVAGMQAPAAVIQDVGSPRDLAAVLSHSRLFIGNDGGVMHLAAAVGVPCVGVFGLTNHRAWGPYPPTEHRVVRLDLPCSPCFYHDRSLGTPEGCPPRTCLIDLSPDLVITAARELLNTISSPRTAG